MSIRPGLRLEKSWAAKVMTWLWLTCMHELVESYIAGRKPGFQPGFQIDWIEWTGLKWRTETRACACPSRPCMSITVYTGTSCSHTAAAMHILVNFSLSHAELHASRSSYICPVLPVMYIVAMHIALGSSVSLALQHQTTYGVNCLVLSLKVGQCL